MNPVNSPSNPSSKLSGLLLNMLSSINQGPGGQSLFDGLLSQSEIETPAHNSTANSHGPVAQNNPSSQHAASDTSNDPNSGNTLQTHAAKGGADWGLLRKFVRHVAAKQNDDRKPAGHAANQQTPANTTRVNAGAKTDPQTSADTHAAPPANCAVATANDGNTNDAPADTADDAKVALAVSADAAISAATTPTPATAQAPAPSDDGDNNDPSTADITDAELLMLLMQLERLAAAQLNLATGNNTASSAGTDSAQSAGSQPNGVTPATGGNPQDKIDLKALLAALAGLNDGTATNGSSAQNDPSATAAQNLAASFPALTASLQSSSSSSSSAPSSSNGNDKWMNAEFLNLFNAVNNHLNDAAAPVAINPAAAATLAASGGDGASLDADGQSQNGANLRGGTAGASLTANNSPAMAGPQQAASPYDFASQLSALRATKGGPTGLPTAVEQVVLQLSRGLSKDGSSQMTIQLRPAELGRVDVKLNVASDGKVQGTVTADSPATLNLLIKDARGLERALQEAGLRADPGSLQFNLRGDGQTGGGFNQNADNSQNYGHGSLGAISALAMTADAPETYYLTPGGVNMRV